MQGKAHQNTQIQILKDLEPDVLLSLYSGVMLAKNFADVHDAAEKLLGRPLLSHQFSEKTLWIEIRKNIIAKCLLAHYDIDPGSQEFYDKVNEVLKEHRF